MRKLIGLLGILLPIVLCLSCVAISVGPLTVGPFVEGKFPSSMSGFYYTRIGPYFIATLCAQGVLFYTYRYAKHDNVLSNVAGGLLVFVALSPTASSDSKTFWNWAHLAASGLFFVIVAWFAGFLFTRRNGTDPFRLVWKRPWPRATDNDKRDWIYRWAAIVIVAALVAAGVDALDKSVNALFWLESIMIFAFSFSWLVKGRFKWFWRWTVFPG